MKKFEYMVLESTNYNEDLNDYGDEGWELVNIIKYTYKQGITMSPERVSYYFKREKVKS